MREKTVERDETEGEETRENWKVENKLRVLKRMSEPDSLESVLKRLAKEENISGKFSGTSGTLSSFNSKLETSH